MTTSSQPYDDLPIETRRSTAAARKTAAETALYNLHLNELEGLPVSDQERIRLTDAISALRDELASLDTQ